MMLEDGTITEFTEEDRKTFIKNMNSFSSHSLRTFLLAYKEVPKDFGTDPDALESDLIAICLLGIQDPLRPAVKGAVADCHKAEITVRMVTGDNIDTAVAICKDAGIITENLTPEQAIKRKIAITGPEFSKLSD